MPYKIAICDDNPTDTEYVSSIVNTWALAQNHLVKIQTFPSAEAFLFQYAEEKDYDMWLAPRLPQPHPGNASQHGAWKIR